MYSTNDTAHLSDLATVWSLVHEAHRGPAASAALAREQLLRQYREPVFRYLRGALRDAAAADDLAQEFALRFLRGDFHRADPARGRFRAYVKTALFRMVIAHVRRQHGQPRPLDDDLESLVEVRAAEQEFSSGLRDGFLSRTWESLADFERRTAQPVHTVLRFRVDHPDLSSTVLGERLSVLLGRPMSAPATRQALYRAREKFGDLLLEEVARTLQEPDVDRLEEELVDLGLLEYCRPALERLSRQTLVERGATT